MSNRHIDIDRAKRYKVLCEKITANFRETGRHELTIRNRYSIH